MECFKRPVGLNRGLRLVVGGLLVLLLALAGTYAFIHGGGNFHEVEKGVLYRSSCLGEAGLEKAIAAHGVRSVLNLCGAQPGTPWYEGETKVARRHSVVFRDLPISANQVPEAAQLQAILDFLRDAPKPLLIHCRAGSDRTGLVCAMFVAARGGSYREADAQLGLYYGHFPYFGSKSIAMDITLDRIYERLSVRQVVDWSAVR